MRSYYTIKYTRPNKNAMISHITLEIGYVWAVENGKRVALEFKDVGEAERWMNKNEKELFDDANYTIEKIYKTE